MIDSPINFEEIILGGIGVFYLIRRTHGLILRSLAFWWTVVGMLIVLTGDGSFVHSLDKGGPLNITCWACWIKASCIVMWIWELWFSETWLTEDQKALRREKERAAIRGRTPRPQLAPRPNYGTDERYYLTLEVTNDPHRRIGPKD